MKKRVLLVSVIPLFAACGQSDNRAIVEACKAQGQSVDKCECVADYAEENLPAGTFEAIAEVSRASDGADEAFLRRLSIDQAASLAIVAEGAGRTCEISAFELLLP